MVIFKKERKVHSKIAYEERVFEKLIEINFTKD